MLPPMSNPSDNTTAPSESISSSTDLRSSHPLLATMGQYGAITLVITVVNALGYLRGIEYPDAWTRLFAGVALLGQASVYVLVAMAPPLALMMIARGLGRLRSKPLRVPWTRWGVYALAVAAASSLQFLVHMDKMVYRMYRMHLDNGFVLNLIQTPGGVQSMGAGTSTQLSFALIALGFVLLQMSVLVVLVNVRRIKRVLNVLTLRRVRIASITIVLACLAFQAVAYGASDFFGHTPILKAAKAFPFHIELTFRKLGKRLGFTPHPGASARIKLQDGALHCPLTPLVRQPGSRRYNVVWLVAESWRNDMLTPEIMPEMSRLAEESVRFNSHYSGGNGTRMAMFAMFYGLYAPYWFPAKESRQGPVLMDFFVDAGYDIRAYTSAKFTYPEFDQTLFARVSADRLDSDPSSEHQVGWKRDRKQIGKLLASLDSRSGDQPFFRFMFFESPHAPYCFPDECAVRPDYARDVNYATMSLDRDMPMIYNRYVNSCRHLDAQLARVFEYLRGTGLLESTIVVVTGDHGEEFLEHGHWGHARGYSDEQVRVPLLLWIPGEAPRTIERMTSHLDLPPTVLRQLGVTNPPEDYCLGFDLLGPVHRTFTVLGDWGNIATMTDEFISILPFRPGSFASREVLPRNGAECSDPDQFARERAAETVAVARDLSRFLR
jgi:uncharacterized protein